MTRRLLRMCIIFLWASSSSQIFAEPRERALATPLSPEAVGTLFTMKGSNTVGASLAPTWAKRYLEHKGVNNVRIESGALENEYRIIGINGHTPVNIQVHAHGTGTGFSALKHRSAEIAISSRPIKTSENELVDANLDLRSLDTEYVVALDGLAVIVHPQNPVQRLTKNQVAQIFSGKITHWNEVGGHPIPINIYARDNKSGTWDTFNSLVLGSQYALSDQALRLESNDHLSTLVSNDAYAIGFVGLASVNQAKALAIAGSAGRALQPLPIYVATEDYALSRRLFMYAVPYMQNAFSREFLAFVQSTEGQRIVKDVGFVSLDPISTALEDQGAPNYYSNLTRYGERVSVNFAFKQGSASLDNKALRDVARLAKFMQKAENQEKLIQLIGFGDRKGNEQRAVILSKLRANVVNIELFKNSVTVESVLGLGSDLTIAESAEGSGGKNQRVEVWLFDKEHKHLLEQAKKDASRSKRQESTTHLIVSD